MNPYNLKIYQLIFNLSYMRAFLGFIIMIWAFWLHFYNVEFFLRKLEALYNWCHRIWAPTLTFLMLCKKISQKSQKSFHKAQRSFHKAQRSFQKTQWSLRFLEALLSYLKVILSFLKALLSFMKAFLSFIRDFIA